MKKNLYTVFIDGQPSTFPISQLNTEELANFKKYIESIYSPEDKAEVVQVSVNTNDVLLQREYSCESLPDIDEDVYYALNNHDIPVDEHGFTSGTYHLTLSYTEDG